MKSLVHFPILSGAKILIKAGDILDPNTEIAEIPGLPSLQIIPVSNIFGIKGEKIPKYLKKNIGEFVKKGEIIAEKRQVFSQLLLKSPMDAKLREIDLKKGTLTLEPSEGKSEKIVTPVHGRVKNISPGYVEMEIEGAVFPVLTGSGKDVTGTIKHVKGERIGILDVWEEVGENVLLCENISGELVAKLEVVGVSGLITAKKVSSGIEIPTGQVSTDIYNKIKELDGKEVWLMPQNKQIAIW